MGLAKASESMFADHPTQAGVEGGAIQTAKG